MLVFSLLSLNGLCFAADPPLPTPVGRVVWVRGNLIAGMDNREERLLQKLSVIYLHDILVTDNKSQAQIIFTDNTLVTFHEGTTFIVDQYSFNKAKEKNGSVGKYVMRLVEGGFRTITGLIAKNNPSDYQVNTPVATIGVRGTDYVVYYHNHKLDVGYYKGTPCVKDQGGKGFCLSKDMKYATVSGSNMNVVLSNQQPTSLDEQLEIIPAQISPFYTPNTGSGGGVATSFCIQ